MRKRLPAPMRTLSIWKEVVIKILFHRKDTETAEKTPFLSVLLGVLGVLRG